MTSDLPAGIGPRDRIVLFDGVCNLCNRGVQFLIAHDPIAKLRLTSAQSPAGEALLAWCGLSPERFNTIVFLEDGRAYSQSTAVLRIARHLTFPWRLFALAIILPRFLRDWLYDCVARNRYTLFGRQDRCLLPTPSIAKRFLIGPGTRTE